MKFPARLATVVKVALAVFPASLGLSLPVSATSHPERNITLIVPVPPGGAGAFIGRLVADRLSVALGAKVVVEDADLPPVGVPQIRRWDAERAAGITTEARSSFCKSEATKGLGTGADRHSERDKANLPRERAFGSGVARLLATPAARGESCVLLS